ncbi:hypothetical protein D3C86_1976730 [compost metagenome]
MELETGKTQRVRGQGQALVVDAQHHFVQVLGHPLVERQRVEITAAEVEVQAVAVGLAQRLVRQGLQLDAQH